MKTLLVSAGALALAMCISPISFDRHSLLKPSVAFAASGSVSTVNVNVTNIPLPVRDVENPARQPVQFGLCTEQGGAVTCFYNTLGSFSDSYTVPHGKRLVIEYIGGHCGIAPETTYYELAVETTVGGNLGHYGIPCMPAAGDSNSPNRTAGQQTRIYADPDTTVRLRLHSDFGDATVFLSGYTITITQ